jgi:hypothetical protein
MSHRAYTLSHGAQPSDLARLLAKQPAGLRGPLLMNAASFRPSWSVEASFAVGELRAAFAEYWESRFGTPVPIAVLRSVLNPPIPVRTAIEFNKFALTCDAASIDAYLATLVQYLADGNQVQRHLF